MFEIPPTLKYVLSKNLQEEALETLKVSPEKKLQLQQTLVNTRIIIDNGVTEKNYATFFHHLLWWEEVIEERNLQKYNIPKCKDIKKERKEYSANYYSLEVPGVAEKRPSLMRGNHVHLRPCQRKYLVIDCIIKDITGNTIYFSETVECPDRIEPFYRRKVEFDVRFILSRMPKIAMHEAVSNLFTSQKRVFPVPVASPVQVKPLVRFYNPNVQKNIEQNNAVRCIVSGTSGLAPYLVYGPPGTGKTVTIVEAIIQIVATNIYSKILVCAESNMASDHIASMLLKCNQKLNIENFLIRANSINRPREVVSGSLRFVSFYPSDNSALSPYRVVVTTLIHSANYTIDWRQKECKLSFTHLFIDEAAQALEPACLVPITGLLRSGGKLILSGDPQQLGPVCVSKEAHNRGLGLSLMERLMTTYKNLYGNSTTAYRYITMLKNNFRSNPDIIEIPNKLFYGNALRYLAPADPLSTISIFEEIGGKRAIVFHAVHSKEEKDGHSPSFFNIIELNILQHYVKRLIEYHKVMHEDIGVISPYLSQASKIRNWLRKQSFQKVEVGTVESFQGKEKRVILVTTVRTDSLGFLVDSKRFNVTLTRAKAKIVIIGNPACLARDPKWQIYMNKCKIYNTYFHQSNEQMESLLRTIEDNFKKLSVNELLTKKDDNNKDDTKKDDNKKDDNKKDDTKKDDTKKDDTKKDDTKKDDNKKDDDKKDYNKNVQNILPLQRTLQSPVITSKNLICCVL